MITKNITVTTSEFSEYIANPLVADDVRAYKIIYNTGLDLSGYAVTITAKRADGVIITDIGTIDGQNVEYILKGNMYSVEGEVSVRLCVCSEDGSVLTAKELIFEVISSFGGSTITADDRYPILETVAAHASNTNNPHNVTAEQLGFATDLGELSSGISDTVHVLTYPAPFSLAKGIIFSFTLPSVMTTTDCQTSIFQFGNITELPIKTTSYSDISNTAFAQAAEDARVFYAFIGTDPLGGTDAMIIINADVEINKLTSLDEGKAPIDHSSTSTTYGIGTSTNYGHLKLSDATNSSSDASSGIAATPKAVVTLANSISANIAPLSDNVTLLSENKVDKIPGMGLSSNDFTGDEKTAVAKIGTYTLQTTSKTLTGAVNELNEVISLMETTSQTTWTHPRSTEILGTRNFTIGTGLMMYEKFDEDKTFDIIEFPCWVTANTKTLICRVYELSAFPTGYGFYPSNLSSYLKKEITITGDALNLSSSTLQSITLEDSITISAGNVCAIGFALSTAESGVFLARYWNSSDETTTYTGTADTYTSNSTIYVADSNSPHRRAFYCYSGNGTGNWDAQWLPYEGNFYATTFKLKLTSIGLGWSSLSGYIPINKIGDGSITPEKLADTRLLDIPLPSAIYGVTGKQLNVYYDCLVADSPKNHLFEVTGTNGMCLAECYRANTVGSANAALTFHIYNPKTDLEMTKDVTLNIVSADSGTAGTKNVLVMGDSIIANGSSGGMVTYSLLQSFASDSVIDVTLLGTQGSGTNLHEGHAGWTASNFISSSSPFYNSSTSAFDFSNYMSTNGYSSCDYVFIHLGINDIFSLANTSEVSTKFNTNLSYYNTIINSIKLYNANTKICFLLPIFPPADESLSLAYPNTGFCRWKYKQLMHFYSCKLIESFDNRQGESIYIVPFGSSLDTLTQFPTQTETANAHTSVSVSRQNNLHPTDSGYAQLSDSIYAFIRNLG